MSNTKNTKNKNLNIYALSVCRHGAVKYCDSTWNERHVRSTTAAQPQKFPSQASLSLSLSAMAYVVHQHVRQHSNGRLSVMHTIANVETPFSRHRHPVDLKTETIQAEKPKHEATSPRITTSSGKQ